MSFKGFLMSFSRLGVLIVSMMVIGGFLGKFHPFFDSLSHFRIHLLGILSLWLSVQFFFTTPKNQYRIFSLLILIAGYLYLFMTPFWGTTTSHGQTIKTMQFNLLCMNQRMAFVSSYLIYHPVDIATLQEVTFAHKRFIDALKPYYPYQVFCDNGGIHGVGGEMIISKFPFTGKGKCLQDHGLVWREIALKDRNVSVVSVHLHWPYPYQQYQQISLLSQELQTLKGSTIVMGDFNAAGWSHSVHRIEASSHTHLIDGVRWSIRVNTPLIPLWLPLDHVLLSPDIGIQDIHVGEDLGSDHRPILTTLRV
jgi:endonuclease/exonuclease/phosphatase (EEP) superfamily protein YafD